MAEKPRTKRCRCQQVEPHTYQIKPLAVSEPEFVKPGNVQSENWQLMIKGF